MPRKFPSPSPLSIISKTSPYCNGTKTSSRKFHSHLSMRQNSVNLKRLPYSGGLSSWSSTTIGINNSSNRKYSICHHNTAAPVFPTSRYSRSYSTAADEQEDAYESLSLKDWTQKPFHNFALLVKIPQEWSLAEENQQDYSFESSELQQMLHFHTKRNHDIYAFQLSSKSADHAAQQFLQEYLKTPKMSNFQAQSGTVVGATDMVYDSFEIEFQEEGTSESKSHWIISLEDSRNERIILFHYVAPTEDFDKPLMSVFLSGLKTKKFSTASEGASAAEEVEVEVEEPDVEVNASQEERAHHESQDPNQFKNFQGQGFDSFFNPDNIEKAKKLMENKDLMQYMNNLIEKVNSLDAKDLEKLKQSSEYQNSRDVRDFVNDMDSNRTFAIINHGMKPDVRNFFTNVVIPLALTK